MFGLYFFLFFEGATKLPVEARQKHRGIERTEEKFIPVGEASLFLAFINRNVGSDSSISRRDMDRVKDVE